VLRTSGQRDADWDPQNMLIGQVLHLSFAHYLCVLRCHRCWAWLPRGSSSAGRHAGAGSRFLTAPHRPIRRVPSAGRPSKTGVTLYSWCCFSSRPAARIIAWVRGRPAVLAAHAFAADARAGDWQLLVLFVGLFVVNYAMQASGIWTR